MRRRHRKGLLAAREAIYATSNASWWEWTRGSRLLFWRWELEFQAVARDGYPSWFQEKPKHCKRPQREYRDPTTARLVASKLEDVLNTCYLHLSPHGILSWMSFFPVPKGLSDVRMVYNGTSNGLNDCLWAPWFPLPTVDAVERSLVPGTCLGDMDVGEMFLNFPLHEDMQKFTGVDLRLFKKYFSDPLAHPDIVCWGRACMGTKPSPYISVRFLLCALEIIKRIKEPHAADNLFRWDEVILNLPGMEKFDSTFPWVYKWDKSRRCVAADI